MTQTWATPSTEDLRPVCEPVTIDPLGIDAETFQQAIINDESLERRLSPLGWTNAATLGKIIEL